LSDVNCVDVTSSVGISLRLNAYQAKEVNHHYIAWIKQGLPPLDKVSPRILRRLRLSLFDPIHFKKNAPDY